MSIQQRLMAREPLDSWSVREQLCLAAAVARNGDQNWMAVSRALRAVGDPSRPPDWYRQKACAAQYSALLEAEETPKRKKRTPEPTPTVAVPPATETSQEGILKRLTAERISELQQLMQDIKSQYAVLKDEVAEVRSPATSEARVREMLSSVEAVRRQRERDQQRHTLWLREREDRRLRAEKARRPLVAATQALSPPASSPLLTSLLKNASATPATVAPLPVTQVLHIPHPSTVIDTVSPSAGAPTLSMLLERGREGAPPPPLPAPPAPPAPNETAVIEHIKSQLQEIEHNLRLGNIRGAASPVSSTLAPAAPAADKVDIDDIEIKAEDVYAFSDMDLEIPPVSTIHKSSLARCIEKGMFSKKEEAELELEVPAPAPPDAAPEQLEPKLEAAEATEEAAEAPEPAPAEVPPEPAEVKVDDAPETSIPLPPEPLATVVAAEALAETLQPAVAPSPVPSPAASPAPSPPPSPAPPAEPPVEVPLDSPPPEDPIEAEMKEMHSEARERRDPSPPSPPPPSPPPPRPRSATDDAAPAREPVKVESAWDETEAPAPPLEAEVEAEAVGEGEGKAETAPEPAEPEHAPPEVKVKQEEEEAEVVATEALGAVGAVGAEAAEAAEAEGTHTETDDDTPMEVIREEETEGRRRRDYSRRKARPLSDSRACSGSESAAESAPASPAPRAAAATPPPRAPSAAAAAAAAPDPDRDHRLWKKSVMLVYNRLCAHKYASLFFRPITNEVAPDYSLVVHQPMDLHTIKRNIDTGVIRTTMQFQHDVLLMLSNALLYNNSRDRVYHMTQDMHEEAAAQLGMLLQAQAHAALADAAASAPARRATPHAKRKRTSSASASAGSPAAKRPRDE